MRRVDRSIWIGYDPREADAFAVARESIRRHAVYPISINALHLEDLRTRGLYYRPTSIVDGRMFDDISGFPMSTEFAISRFLVPHLARSRWALFIDADFLALSNVDQIFKHADPNKAVMVVKHQYDPPEGVKMDGQAQTRYARKNWSSCILFNVTHPANEKLTVELINTVPGRDLHGFCWLDDDEIGELPVEWNYLVGHSRINTPPALVHFTEGIPRMTGYENSEFAAEWRKELSRWLNAPFLKTVEN